MNIYFNGDSYVAGSELEDPATQGFAAKLANKLDATFINQAVGGSSNSLIIRKVDKFLNDCERTGNYPDLIVIGWSEAWREDWFIDNSYVSVAGTGPDYVHHNPIAYQYWNKSMNQNQDYQHQMCKFYNRVIYNLSQHLDQLKIPHLFFNAIVPLNITEIYDPNSLQDDPLLKLSWGNNFFYPYDQEIMTWRGWAIANNHREITPGKFHYDELAHTGWADVIYNYIKEKNIV